jgi:chromosome segregation ATPase
MSEHNQATAYTSEEDAGMSFVEREMRRRKRLLRFYLALLIIPVLLGIAVLIFGRSDRQMVTEELKNQTPLVVRETVGTQVAPAIQTEVEKQITPTLGQINELKTRQDSITNEVKTLSASTTKLTPEEVESIRQSGERLAKQDAIINELQTTTRQSQERFNRQDAMIRDIQKQNESIRGQMRDQNLSDINARLGRLEGQIKALSGRLNDMVKRGGDQGGQRPNR